MSVDSLFELVPTHCDDCGRRLEAHQCVWCSTRTGDGARAAGQDAVTVDLEWNHRADAWLGQLYLGVVVSADDLVAEVGLPTGSPNQVGAKFSSWAKARRIRPEGVTTSRRRESHGRLMRTWKVTA